MRRSNFIITICCGLAGQHCRIIFCCGFVAVLRFLWTNCCTVDLLLFCCKLSIGCEIVVQFVIDHVVRRTHNRPR